MVFRGVFLAAIPGSAAGALQLSKSCDSSEFQQWWLRGDLWGRGDLSALAL